MTITQISRTYSRSISFKKPDGQEMWIKHEMSATAEFQGDDSDIIKATGDMLEEVVRKEVGTSIKAEKAKIEASFNPKADEPFEGTTPGIGKVKKMPRL